MELVEERVTPTPPRLEPIVPNSGCRFHLEGLYRPEIKGHSVILDVTPEFRAENGPDVFQRKLTAD